MDMEPVDPDCPKCVRPSGETYHYLYRLFLFDVDRAWKLAYGTPRESVELETESVEWSVQTAHIQDRHVGHVDATIPGLIAHVRLRTGGGGEVRGHVLIDGHHRAARCLREGLPFFAYILTEAESDEIVLRRPDGVPMSPWPRQKTPLPRPRVVGESEFLIGQWLGNPSEDVSLI